MAALGRHKACPYSISITFGTASTVVVGQGGTTTAHAEALRKELFLP